MADDKIRLGQVIGVFGPASMLDLPERSVLVLGLDHWEMFGAGTFKVIEEVRLARLLHQRLKDDGRLVADHPPELRTPPIDAGDPRRPSPGIKATVFPRWFACDAVAGDPPNRRRLVRLRVPLCLLNCGALTIRISWPHRGCWNWPSERSRRASNATSTLGERSMRHRCLCLAPRPPTNRHSRTFEARSLAG
jgi:hypothetical protein